MLIIAPVASEQAASYGVIIDAILAKSDLESVSRSQVRKQLENRIGQDLSDYKVSDITSVRMS